MIIIKQIKKINHNYDDNNDNTNITSKNKQ